MYTPTRSIIDIDQLVYKLYGLTQGEIKIVEGKKLNSANI